MENVFDILNNVNVNERKEVKKVGDQELSYLSWPWAWAEVKRRYPDAHYTIWRDEKGLPFSFDPATGYMVFTTVTIDGISHEMWLPVMDGANRAMRNVAYKYNVKNPKFKYAKLNAQTGKYMDDYGREQPQFFEKTVEAATMTDINKTIMRCLVKNLAMFGLGLYIYAGEDLPEGEKTDGQEESNAPVPAQMPPQQPGNVKVTTSSSVPAKAPEAPKEPDLSTATGYIQNEIGFMAQKYNLTKKEMAGRFETMRKALVAAGMVNDIKSKDMTLEDAKMLIEIMTREYLTDMEQTA